MKRICAFTKWSTPSHPFFVQKADLDGNGVLSRTEIKDQLAPFIGLKMSEEEVDDFIVRADKNKDGNVDYEEFIQMVSKQN